jgi:hypothetical protein
VGQKEGSPIRFREGRKYSPPSVGETPYAISPLKPDKEKASGLNKCCRGTRQLSGNKNKFNKIIMFNAQTKVRNRRKKKKKKI